MSSSNSHASEIAYEAYFNCGSYTTTGTSGGFRLSPNTINPLSRAEYVRLWKPGESPSGPITYQAEAATLSGATAATSYTGYTGTAYVNYENRVGSYIEWQVQAASAGGADLTFRYSNGSSTSRPVRITINGIVVSSSFAFGGTGGWGSWKTKTLPANLNSGTNTVRAESIGSSGGPHMDRVNLRLK